MTYIYPINYKRIPVIIPAERLEQIMDSASAFGGIGGGAHMKDWLPYDALGHLAWYVQQEVGMYHLFFTHASILSVARTDLKVLSDTVTFTEVNDVVVRTVNHAKGMTGRTSQYDRISFEEWYDALARMFDLRIPDKRKLPARMRRYA